MSSTTINSKPDARTTSASDKVRSELDVLTARLRRDICFAGLLIVAAIAGATLLVTTISDAILQPESIGLRLLLWVPILAGIAAAAYRFVWNPLRERGNRLALAWSLEEQRPELHERLTSTLLLADTEQPVASSLINAVAAQANRKLAGCRDDAATRRDWRRPLVAATSCVMIAVFCFLVWPQYLVPSLSNVMTPWGTRQLPHLTATITPGNIAVAEGEPVEVLASSRGLGECVLEIVEDNKVASSTPMVAGKNGDEAKVVLPGLSANQTYRVRSGSLVSHVYEITVHPRPVVAQATATLQYPDYTDIPQATIDDLSAPMAAVPGTQVTLSVTSSVPTSKTRLMFANELHDVARTNNKDGQSQHQWNLRTNEQPVQTGKLTLTSEHDVSSEPFKFEFRSVPDNPPGVSITSPALPSVVVAPDGSLPIQFEAADDFGLQSIELLTQVNDAKPTRDVVLQNAEEPTHAGQFTFEPKKRDLKTGDQLVLWLVASDNRTDEYGGSQTVKSQQLIIAIANDAASVGRQQIAEEQNRILKSLEDAIEKLEAAREAAQQIADKQPGEEGIENAAPADTDAEKLQQQLQDAQQALKDVAEPGKGNAPLFADEKEQIGKIADEQLEEAKQQARLIPLTDDPNEKQQNANAARESVEKAEEQLKALREQLQAQAEKLERAADLDELARLQNELARKLEEEKKAPEDAGQEQEKIADELQDMVQQDEDAEREQFLQRAEEAEQLAQQTDQLQQQQEQLANTDRQRTKEETREQLTKMIREEQRALTAETKKLKDQENKTRPNAAPEKSESKAKAEELMDQISDELGNKDLDAAEQKAEQAKQQLQEAANQQKAADDAAARQKPQANKKKLDQLARRQEQIKEAIKAVKEDKVEDAKDKLQDLITDRLEQVTKEAEELLDLPSDDKENEQAKKEAKQKLKDALNDSKQASQNKKPSNSEKQQAAAKGQQTQQVNKDGQSKDQPQAGQKNEQSAKQSQAGKKDDPQQQKAGDEKQQAGAKDQRAQQPNKDSQPKDQPQAGQKNEQNAKQNQVGKKDAAQEQKAGGEKQQAGAKDQQAQQANIDGQPKDQQQAGQKNEQNAKQEQADEKNAPQRKQARNGQKQAQQQRQDGQQNQQKAQQQKPDAQNQQKKKAAKSLKQASQSLQKFCKSCRKCANCNNPSSSSGGGSGKSSPSGNKKPFDKPGNKKAGEDKPGNKQGGSKKPGNKQQAGDKPGGKPQGARDSDKGKPAQDGQKKSGSSKQLAKTTDNAQKAARKPTPGAAKQVTKELDQLADDAARKTGYPRKDGQESKGEPGQKQQRQGDGTSGVGSKGKDAKGNTPTGVQGQGDPDPGVAAGLKLRGPSTSEWTRSQKLLRGNVLDSKKTLIPESYRGVVEDYFEQLSKIQSDDKDAKEKP